MMGSWWNAPWTERLRLVDHSHAAAADLPQETKIAQRAEHFIWRKGCRKDLSLIL
jgi:hypothetical protein